MILLILRTLRTRLTRCGKLRVLLALTAFAALAPLFCQARELGPDPAAMPAARGQERLVVVLAPATRATVWAFARSGGVWKESFQTRGFVGRGGVLRNKKEGDGATPAGAFAMHEAFGTAEDPGSALPYHRVRPGDLWVDDPASRHYNRLVEKGAGNRDWNSAEDLAAQGAAYRYALVIGYNTDPVVKGAGSAIFLHCSTGGPTAGCVSVPEKDMIRLLRFLRPGDRIVIGASPGDLR